MSEHSKVNKILRTKSEALVAPAHLTKAAHALGAFLTKADYETGEIEGYGSKWDLVDSYGEAVVKGAFTQSLKEWGDRPIPMLWQHSQSMPVGVWTDYREDDTGLKLRGKINKETARGRDALSDIKMGSVGGLSIGYYEMVADTYNVAERQGFRKLHVLDLREVSVVTFPALREARIDAVKSRLARGETLTEREMEIALREKLNLSRSEAKTVIKHGYSALLRDAGAKKKSPELSDVLAALRQMNGSQ